MITVKQIIETLSTMPQNAIVAVYDKEGNPDPVVSVTSKGLFVERPFYLLQVTEETKKFPGEKEIEVIVITNF